MLDSALETTLQSHAVNAGLLAAGQPLSGPVAELMKRMAALCAEICERGGNRTAMFAAVDEEAKTLTEPEVRFAAAVVERCAAIARGHRFDRTAGLAIRTTFRAGLTSPQD